MRHIRDLTSSENLLVVSSRFWFKAHVFKCNTPLILLRDVFKSAKLSNSIRDFHSLMMGIAHMTKAKDLPAYRSPVTGEAEELLIKNDGSIALITSTRSVYASTNIQYLTRVFNIINNYPRSGTLRHFNQLMHFR